jgi:ParB-like nuclease domain
MHKSLPKLQSTANHEQFVQSEFNRDLRGLDALLKSMRKHGFIAAYPLHCTKGANGKLVIKAGHHRFEAAKTLGIPVYYVVSEDNASIAETEMTANVWNLNDYVKSYARSGSDSHLSIIEFSEKTGIKYGQAASLLAGNCADSHNVANKVKDGSYSTKDRLHADKVGSVVIALRDIGVAFANSSNMVGALSSVCWLVEFDAKKFIHRAATNTHLFVKQATKNQYLDLIEKVYNFHANERIALAFLARESAKKRNAVSKNAKS